MIEIRKKSELTGTKKHGQCASCGKECSEVELYNLFFSYKGSMKNNSIDLCWDCMVGMGNVIYEMYETETYH